MEVNRNDLFWSYAAAILKIGSALILLPFLLRYLPQETVGVWTIYMTINALALLLDFGFNPTFTRNVTYLFSGVRNLKAKGFESVDESDIRIDFRLLGGLISAMKYIYLRIALLHLLLLASLGTFYLSKVIEDYSGSLTEVWLSWFMLIVVNTYQIYTLYYESLLLGKGLVRISRQIIILGQVLYMIIALLFLKMGFGLVAIVAGQIVSVIVIRLLSYRSFFTDSIRRNITVFLHDRKRETLRTLYPNAFRVGLTSIGGFMVQRSSLIIGSLYLSLSEIASYGITMQILAVISGLASVYTGTFQPRITSLQVAGKKDEIKSIYLKGQIVMVLTFISGGGMLVLFGQDILSIMGSQTPLLSEGLIVLCLLLAMEQTNITVAGSILLTKNIVPFFKASIISGLSISVLLLGAFTFLNLGIITLILVPLIVDISYQAWKWPLDVINDLKIGVVDVRPAFRELIRTDLLGLTGTKSQNHG